MNKLKLTWGPPKYITIGKRVICILTLECDGWCFTDKGVATCHDDDKYDFKKGSKLAICRAKRKLISKLYNKLGGYEEEKYYSSVINELLYKWGGLLKLRTYKLRLTDEIKKLANE